METIQRIQKKFFRGVAWNTVEALVFHAAIIIHQLVVFKLTTPKFYGQFGTLFALSYMIESLLDFGYLSSIGPLFTWLSSCKQNFKSWCRYVLFPQLALFILIPTIFFLYHKPIFLNFKHISIVQIFIQHKYMLVIFLAAIAFDGARKTLNGLMQVAFLNKQAACAEIVAIAVYLSLVWGQYFAGIPLSLYSTFGSLVISTGISVIIMSRWVAKWHKGLPEEKALETKIPLKSIFKNRIFNYSHELSTQFFSHGFLVPFFAVHIGMEQAGVFQIISSTEQYIRSIIKRMFGLTSNALLAHIKQATLSCKQKMFYLASSRLFPILYTIFIFMVINITRLIPASGISVSWGTIYFFFIFAFLHNFFVVYERFYIIEEKVQLLFYANSIALSIFAIIIYLFGGKHLLFAYASLAIIRVFYYAAMIYVSYKIWNIKASWTIRLRNFLIILFASILVFFSV
ncbi:hypothetical protein HN446_04940 [bacterium]|jgi:hypothetical protein|nr:hypothetical protein [bacterium]